MKSNDKTEGAAIQPAGDIPMGYVNLETLDCAISFYQDKVPEGYLPFYLAPVSAPVPQAGIKVQYRIKTSDSLGMWDTITVSPRETREGIETRVKEIAEAQCGYSEHYRGYEWRYAITTLSDAALTTRSIGCDPEFNRLLVDWCEEIEAASFRAFAAKAALVAYIDTRVSTPVPEDAQVKTLLLDWWMNDMEDAEFFNRAGKLLGVTSEEYANHAVPEAVPQFRTRGCSDWYDGQPDDSDGGGPYETRTLYKAPVPEAKAEQMGLVLAPHYRGYANLGTGQYLLNHSRDGQVASLIISVATDEEKAGRVVGDERDNAPDAVLRPEAMAVRIDFTTVAGLDALENQLRKLRAEHFAATAVKHEASELPPLPKMLTIARDQYGDMVRGYTAKEMLAYGQLCRSAASSIAVPAANSIGDDAEFQHRMADIISALDEDTENGTDVAYDRARSKFIAYINRWADARSPVAAAPDTSARDADSKRLDWFDQQRVAYGFEGIQEGNEWIMNGPFATIRHAIDAAILSATAASSGEKGVGDA